MVLALVLTLISIASGILLTYSYDEQEDLATRVAEGAPLGLVGLGLVGLVWSTLLRLDAVAVVISSTLLMVVACVLGGSRAWRKLRSELGVAWGGTRSGSSSHGKQWIGLALAFAAMSLVLWQVFDRAMFFNGGAMCTGVSNNYGDLPFHLAVITRFAYGGNMPPEDPVYSGTRFTYPYLADFVASMLVRSGASLRGAILLESLVLGLSLLWLLVKWSLELTGDRAAALITPVLVLLGGGWGFTQIFGEARQTERGLISLIWRPIHDYTMLSHGEKGWGDSLTYLFVTQRSMLLGVPLAIIIFRQFWRAFITIAERDQNAGSPELKSDEVVRTSKYTGLSTLSIDVPMVGAGVIAGFLPVCHTHTFLAVMGVAGCLAIISRDWRRWASFFVPGVLLGASQAWSIAHGSTVDFRTFFAQKLGWQSEGEDVFWFWLKNTGVLIPLIVLGALKRGANPLLPRRLLLYYVAFLPCLVVPNLVKLAPWTWDNIKVLFYWYLASAPLAGLVLSSLWRRGGWLRTVSAILMVSLVFSGSLNVFRVITGGEPVAIFNAEQMEFAEVIKQDTPANALILHAPVHDDPVFLTGRRSFMGYPGHIWTHGIDYVPREHDIRLIYEGGPSARDLIVRYNIQYAVVGPQEKNLMKVDDAFFDRFGKVAEVGEYRLYKTR
jgi:hypothetical protein